MALFSSFFFGGALRFAMAGPGPYCRVQRYQACNDPCYPNVAGTQVTVAVWA